MRLLTLIYEHPITTIILVIITGNAIVEIIQAFRR